MKKWCWLLSISINVLFFCYSSAYAQWAFTGNDIYNSNTGSVSICSNGGHTCGAANDYIHLEVFASTSSTYITEISTGGAGGPYFLISTNSNVGMGLDTADVIDQRLVINGNIRFKNGGGIIWSDGSVSSTTVTKSTWSFLTNTSNDTSNTGWQVLGKCIKSTVTVTVGSSSQLVHISFTGVVANTNGGAQTNIYGALMDGAFIENEGLTVGLLNQMDCPGSTNCNVSFNKMVTGLSAGQHNFCFTEASTAGTNGNVVKANYQFGVEIPTQ